jgi:L-amino acid N-acyltransferase YncA
MKIRKAVPADADAVFWVRVKSWQTSYAGILPARFLADLGSPVHLKEWQEDRDNLNHNKVTYVAEDDQGTIVGFAIGGPERTGDAVFQGELYAIYLLEQNQHQGIGTGLVQMISGELMTRGYPSMLVWAISANPTRGFYEKLGGEVVDQKEIEIGGAYYTEVAYGWRDIRALASLVPARG